ncbi:MAG: hypothetical protein GEU95_10070 [Rhizobiales bacterium]|nr:hypothetical protein [Hyphomicrobiales bacterium]
MKLIAYYVVIQLIGDAIAVFIGFGIEKVAPAISMPIFLLMYFTVLWGAWVIAVRMTEPQTESAPLAGATGDQRA